MFGKPISDFPLIFIISGIFNFYPSQIPDVDAVVLFFCFPIPIYFPLFPFVLVFIYFFENIKKCY